MTITEQVKHAIEQPFGKVLADKMALTSYTNGSWSEPIVQPLQPLSLSPGAHVFHYASACFEGLKAHRFDDGSIHIFRLDAHLARLQQSAQLLCLPLPDESVCRAMIVDLVRQCREWVPQHPGTLYIRPTLIGTEPSIGSAATPSKDALFYVLVSPVGSYFKGGIKPLRLSIETTHWRTSPEFGLAKAGGNYAAALKMIQDAKNNLHVDQVLFAPGNDVQETGAANFMLLNDRQLITKPLDTTFLHGVTRDSILTIARELGYEVREEAIPLDRLLAWVPNGEAVLTGTAAVLASVGTLIHKGEEIKVGNGEMGPNAARLRSALVNIQNGTAPDHNGWLTAI
ncbi:MAG: branched-chain amino acid aminotransferase [Acidobacteria bacterium]|nr:branched-chain amino acid aminotransferase [Acidobacteriota bacterium]